MKRTWTDVEIAPHAAGYAILLDGQPARLMGADGLVVRHAKLADAIAEEWREARPVFSADTLLLTRLARSVEAKDYMVGMHDRLAAYAVTDVLCYRDSQDPDLAAHEAQAWDPWLDWAAVTLAARLVPGHGVGPIAQPPAALAALRKALAMRTSYELAALGLIVPALGSLILGLAIALGALAPAPACTIAEVESLWQEARWGADPAATRRRARISLEVTAAAKFMELCHH